MNTDPQNDKTDLPCRHTFASAVDLFLQLAKERAENGHVSVASLDFVAQAIQSDPEVRRKYCDAHFENCATHMRNSVQMAPRINVYGRIIAQPFERLIKTSPTIIPSAQLANFFHAMENILGRAEYEGFMERSLRLMGELSYELGNSFSYEDLYAHPDCWDIRWDSQMAMAAFFQKFQIRKDWFKRIMQSNPETPGLGVGRFPYADFHFKAQMMCVFEDFTNLSDEERARFEQRYNKAQRKALSAFLANIAALEEEL